VREYASTTALQMESRSVMCYISIQIRDIGRVRVPADSLPITNVTGDLCCCACFRALFAQARNVRTEVRDNGIFQDDQLVLGERQHSEEVVVLENLANEVENALLTSHTQGSLNSSRAPFLSTCHEKGSWFLAFQRAPTECQFYALLCSLLYVRYQRSLAIELKCDKNTMSRSHDL